MSPPPVLVFDLDGTLVDTAPDLLGTLNAVLAEAGHAPVEEAIARTMIGRGARMMLARGFAARGVDLDAAGLDRANARFLDLYEARVAAMSRPFPGVEDALDRFAAAGFRLAVCTNKYERLSRLLLDALGLSDRFAAIAGQETFGVSKPHRDHILKTVAAAGGSPEDAVMVGDSITDIDAARAAGVPVVAVSFGYTDIPVRDLAPDRVIDAYDELWDTVASLRRPAAGAAVTG
jgi:phosphoglycolate phosphatase